MQVLVRWQSSYLYEGLMVTRVHRAAQWRSHSWLEPFVDFVSTSRRAADADPKDLGRNDFWALHRGLDSSSGSQVRETWEQSPPYHQKFLLSRFRRIERRGVWAKNVQEEDQVRLVHPDRFLHVYLSYACCNSSIWKCIPIPLTWLWPAIRWKSWSSPTRRKILPPRSTSGFPAMTRQRTQAGPLQSGMERRWFCGPQ